MSTSIITVPTVNLNFDIKTIDQATIATALQQFVTLGSTKATLVIEDIDTSVLRDITPAGSRELMPYLNAGGRLFDYLAWTAFGKPASTQFNVSSDRAGSVPSITDVCKAVFFCYFYLLTQARYPPRTNTDGTHGSNVLRKQVPKFLTVVMGCSLQPEEYCQMLASFELERFGTGWVRHISFQNFGNESMNRFGLGVAGYRYFAPFSYISVKEDAPENIKAAARWAKSVAEQPHSWKIHPVTRDAAMLTKYGNLNKGLSNLMLDAFTTEQIEGLVRHRQIYAVPTKDPLHTKYTQWEGTWVTETTDRIFPAVGSS
jgi:hypothetical protein